jgi:ubiquinone/menaquinone biosynthesis C-methylase UbiE
MIKKRVLKPVAKKNEEKTSWGGVAEWYQEHLEDSDTYHTQVLLPNLLRLLPDIAHKHVLDLACGNGFFTRALAKAGAHMEGVDISKTLIEQAKAHKEVFPYPPKYHVTVSDDLYMIKDGSMDVVVCMLALQNIERLGETFKEVRRVLKKGGKFLFVINHPAFRNPKHSSWGYDEKENIQYRRIDEYMTESKTKIDMNPGSTTHKEFTVSFHRPLQSFMKALHSSGLAVTRLEEWVGHRKSAGKRAEAENKARHEIPLFLMLEAVHL